MKVALFGLVAALLLSAPAQAVTVRVDWWADAVPNVPSHPLGTIHVEGSFGAFEVAAFPALLPVEFPFSARAERFGPGYSDDVYVFEYAANLAFEFTGVGSGLRGVGGDGIATANKIVCSPSPEYCVAGEAWTLELNARADGSPASLVLIDSSLSSGYSYFWGGPVHYAFTVVPEPATLGLLSAGLVALGVRRRATR